MKFLRLSPVIADITQTAIVNGVVFITLILTTRIFAQGLGPDEFGVYSLARRVISTVLTFTTLGLTIAIPRYLGFYSTSLERQKTYIISEIVLILVPLAAFSLISMVFPTMISTMLLGSKQSKDLLYGFLTLLIGLTLHMTNYAIFRGRMEMKYANALQILNIALVPLIVALFLAKSSNASLVLTAIGLGIIAISSGPLLWHFIGSCKALRSKFKDATSDLLKYGVPRVPANMGLALMFMLGPWLAARLGEIREAGYFIVGQVVLSMLEEPLAAIGLVLLPRLAQFSGKRERERLREYVSNLVGFSLHLGTFVSIQLFIYSDWIILLWLGEAYRPAIPIMRTVLASAGAYVLYVSLRSAIDADEVKAINTRNIWLAFVTSFITALAFYALGLGSLAFAIGLAVGIGILGLLSLIFVLRRFALNDQRYQLKLALMLNLGMGLTAYGLKQLAPLSYVAIIYTIAAELIFVVIYGLVLKRAHVAWFESIAHRINFRFKGV